jgi:phage-related protein
VTTVATITSLSFRLNSFYNGEGIRQARNDIARLDSSMNALTKSSRALVPGMRDVVSMALALGPALGPIAGGLLGVGAAASSAFVGAGAALGIFTIAMTGAIKSTVGQGSAVGSTAAKLQTAQKALDNTTKGTKEYDKALQKVTQAEKAHEAAITALPPVQEKFARAYDAAKVAILDFNTANAKFTLGPATTMLEAFMALLPKMTPVLAAISPVMQKVANATKAWVTDGGLDRFIKYLIQYGVPALDGFMGALRTMFGALGKGMRDTGPLGLAFVAWLQKTMNTFKQWADGGGFQRFMAWLSENSPMLISALRDLGTFLGNVGEASASMAPEAFAVLGTFLKVLASFPPGLIEAMAYAYIFLNTALTAYRVLAFSAALATTAMTLAATPFGILLAGAALTIGAVILALAALAVGLYFLVKHWDTVWGGIKDIAKVTWEWMKGAWDTLWGGIKTAAVAVWDFLTNGWGQFLLMFMGPIGLIIAVVDNWNLIWGGLKTATAATWQWLQDKWAAVTGGLKAAWDAVRAPIMESWNAVWPQMREAAVNIWNFLSERWSSLWLGMRLIWDAFWGFFGPTFKVAWSGAVATVQAIWTALQAAWQVTWTIIQAIFQTAWAVLSGAWQVGWSALTGMAQVAWSILTGAWKTVWSVVTGIWNTFYAIFSGSFSAGWNVIVAIATGIWNTIKALWTALWATVTAIFTTFLAIFTGNWGTAWNSIKDAAAAIWNVIKVGWQAFLNVIMTALTGFINIAKAAWSAFWTAVQTVATTFWNALRTTFQTFLTALQNLWTTAWNAVRTIFQTIMNGITSAAQAFWTALRAVFQAGLTFLSSLWNTTWTAIRTFFSGAATSLRQSAEQLWTWLRDIFSAGSNWLRTTFWNPVNTFFTKTIPAAFEAGKNALGRAWDGIRKLVRDPIQAVVNVVYNNGIVGLWNAVAGVFGGKKLDKFTLPAFARGGSTGEGPGKEKRGFPAILHPNEHVWTSREVAAAGGHDAVARMRSQALRGERVRTYGRRGGRFDEGGGILGTGIGGDFGPDLVPDGIVKNAIGKLKDVVLGGVYKVISGPINSAVKSAQSAVRAIIPGSPEMETAAQGIPRKMADMVLDWIKTNDVAPTMAGGSVEAALTWAKSQVGKPYQWGGVGPSGYDCSGFMSAIQNVIMGGKIHQRQWATAAFSGSVAPSGWKRSEKAPFMVGITNAGVGHTAGTLNGINVESSGGVGVRVGGNARGYNNNMFTDWYGYTPSKAAKGGTSPAAAKATAKAMLQGYGWSGHWPALEALWTRESGWRWNADNPSSDAYGIPQALPGSKMASAGKDWRTNPGTQIKWGLGYIKGRYGNPSSANNFQKANNWYARGTHSAFPGWGVVGENGIEAIKMRGGEDIKPLESMVGNGGSGSVTVKVDVYAPGATHAVVDRLATELPEKLRMALEQKVGGRL